MAKKTDRPPAEVVIKQKMNNLAMQLEACKKESAAAKLKHEQMEITGQQLVGAITGLQELLKDF